ncbi:MAG: acyltransferase family protein, partial [Clostridia bacterium]|nr:acyltransferase family protein [Clostridia bacterium]
MVFVYAALLVLTLIGSKLRIKSFNTDSYLSMDSTNTVRGFFMMLIFLSHFMQYYAYTQPLDLLGGKISRTLGQMIVVMFMFYSGYGVCESVKRKGTGYIKTFPKNRVLKTLIHFDIAILIYFILSLILGAGYPAKQVILAFIGWESIGNSNWYIFAVIILYLLTWVSFTVFRKNKILAVLLTTVLIGGYIAVICNFKEYWWYDTVLCYAAGLWYSLYKE